jgi:hypothetical protein
MPELSDAVQQLLEKAEAAQVESKEADKEYTSAFKALSSATRAEKKAKEAALQAHKNEKATLHAIVEYFLNAEKDAPVEPPTPPVDEEPVPPAPAPAVDDKK